MQPLEISSSFLISVALLLAGCAHRTQPDPLRPGDFHVLGIAPGPGAEGINDALGGSDYTITVARGAASERNRIIQFWNDSVEFTVVEVEDQTGAAIGVSVVKIRLISKEVRTARDLKIGDGVNRLRRLYGEPYSVREGIWRYEGPATPHGRYRLEVEVEAERVSQVTMSLGPGGV